MRGIILFTILLLFSQYALGSHRRITVHLIEAPASQGQPAKPYLIVLFHNRLPQAGLDDLSLIDPRIVNLVSHAHQWRIERLSQEYPELGMDFFKDQQFLLSMLSEVLIYKMSKEHTDVTDALREASDPNNLIFTLGLAGRENGYLPGELLTKKMLPVQRPARVKANLFTIGKVLEYLGIVKEVLQVGGGIYSNNHLEVGTVDANYDLEIVHLVKRPTREGAPPEFPDFLPSALVLLDLTGGMEPLDGMYAKRYAFFGAASRHEFYEQFGFQKLRNPQPLNEKRNVDERTVIYFGNRMNFLAGMKAAVHMRPGGSLAKELFEIGIVQGSKRHLLSWTVPFLPQSRCANLFASPDTLFQSRRRASRVRDIIEQ